MMNKHLKLVREFNHALALTRPGHEEKERLSDMDIVIRQALLMAEGSETFKAIKTGEMAELLSGLVRLAYYALDAIANQGHDVVDYPVTWRHDGSVMSVMRILTDKINQCTSGSSSDYSELYCLCVHLTRSFINANFDQAFQMIHDSNLSKLSGDKLTNKDAEEIKNLTLPNAPDLSECLYE